MNDQKLAATEFTPRTPTLHLIFFLIFYGGLFGSVVVLGVREMILDGSPAGAMLLTIGYFAAAVFILFYAILSQYRFKFTEPGVIVFTWRGRQFFAWKHIKRASLSSYKANVDLVLHAGGVSYITIPLKSFARSATLLESIRLKLPVPIVASEKQLASITND